MIVGLTGKKGCGKSSVAAILAEKYGYEHVSFATPIKAMLKAIGFTDRQLNDPIEKEKLIPELGKSPRECMQLLGTEFGRAMVKDSIWVTSLEKRLDKSKNYVIDDVRFPNEAAMIHANGGKVVRVVRASQEMSDDAHISEAGLDSEQIDMEINNVSNYVTDLEYAVTNTIENILYYGTLHDPKSKRVASI
jgi:cytidylate kinase